MKNRREHRVPLSQQALAALEELHKVSGHSQWLMPGRLEDKPASQNTMIFAVYRMGFHKRTTVDGFRALASTILNEAVTEGDAKKHRIWSVDAVERALTHTEQNKVNGAYDRGDRLEERTRMMQWWADHLDTRDDAWINKHDLIGDFDEIASSVPNEELRAQINDYFQRVLPDDVNKKETDTAVIATVSRFPALIDYYIRFKEEHGDEAKALSEERVQETERVFIDHVGQLFYMDGKPVKREADLQVMFKLGNPTYGRARAAICSSLVDTARLLKLRTVLADRYSGSSTDELRNRVFSQPTRIRLGI